LLKAHFWRTACAETPVREAKKANFAAFATENEIAIRFARIFGANWRKAQVDGARSKLANRLLIAQTAC